MLKQQLNTPLGPMTAMSDGLALNGLWFVDQKYYGSTLPRLTLLEQRPIFTKVQAWLDAYFAGKKPTVDFAVQPAGTPFRQAVWDQLRRIPYGEVTTYGTLATVVGDQVGHFVSAQAIGGAVGHNPISLVIPCHRVVAGGGELTGYAGGLARKQALLRLEGQLKTNEDHVILPETP
ncbi:methylated-DNA--[protein]-cysteine S-methyltransferase [Levilactobacillus suantsaiihabitans]|uniref:methylated-DNA--[protein]-cysteine S-methyltransferase n=1 Tax=Levilactobacillus suantsaiihabitans TaxID=2487722 RepID=A0A4Z0JED2_9LACO|nr:methylated-DNA--[protein]-cysteine S-methyltransferase [Levilactobacillus suantsaiihabitans]TGD19773.1 methylated-DNA--[protein]-cysteine S-methyltransferase [Levilactobacillus suantsaiihabitans]